jgi:hypothetical protein
MLKFKYFPNLNIFEWLKEKKYKKNIKEVKNTIKNKEDRKKTSASNWAGPYRTHLA